MELGKKVPDQACTQREQKEANKKARMEGNNWWTKEDYMGIVGAMGSKEEEDYNSMTKAQKEADIESWMVDTVLIPIEELVENTVGPKEQRESIDQLGECNLAGN